MMKTAEATPNLFEQINYPKDRNNMTDLEKKHWPRIECPDTVEANKPFEVTVNVGVGIDHPSELAHFIDAEGNSSAKPVWDALTPSVAQFGQAGRIIASSTPAGPLGKFAEVFQRANSGEDQSGVAWQFPTWEMNPRIDRAWLLEQEADDPEMFRAEYGAEFLGGSGGLLDWDRVQVADYVELPPSAGRDWVLAVDVAVQRDPFAAVVVGRDVVDSERLVVGAVYAWRPGRPALFESKAEVEAELFGRALALGGRFGCSRVVADQHMSLLVKNRFTAAGFQCTIEPWTGPSRYQAMVDLRSALYTGVLELPDDPDLHAELKQVRVKYAGASSTVVTPRTSRGHCDRALALAAGVRHVSHRPVQRSAGRLQRDDLGPKPISAGIMGERF